jgi:hypothetical protein
MGRGILGHRCSYSQHGFKFVQVDDVFTVVVEQRLKSHSITIVLVPVPETWCIGSVDARTLPLDAYERFNTFQSTTESTFAADVHQIIVSKILLELDAQVGIDTR